MLDEYIDTQKIVYKTLINTIKKNVLSHAYLFETNGNKDAYQIVLAFAKCLLCKDNYSNSFNCRDCKQCSKIDKNIFSDLKIINADGLWIKKEQLDELQKEFSTKSVESNRRIYIINNAEKLNLQSANSILKFLEEPEDNIIAILITNNIYQLLETIVSRCQIISLSNTKKEDLTLEEKVQALFNIEEIDENFNQKIEAINNFIIYLEQNKLDTVLMTQKLFHEYFKERKDFLLGFDLIILYYKDVINLKLNRNIEIYDQYKNELEKISNMNTISELIKKINIVLQLKEHIKINANQSLLLDKLIIELNGGM